jgi:CheY-like chemotaxis protein
MCDSCFDGNEALYIIMQDVERTNNGIFCSYDLILMDCNMPFLDGYDATIQIREYLYSMGID